MFKEKDVVFVLLLISLLIRLFFFLHFQDPSTTGHLIPALLEPSWSMSKFVGHHVPPMAIYLTKIARLFNDTAQGVRLPNLILGSLLVIPFYYLVRVIYNQEVAFFSGLALAVFYKHIHMSATSFTEIPLYTFLFTALALFFWFKETKKPLFLLLSSISLNLATMSRYESWVFIPLLTVFLLKEKKRYLIGFFLLSLAFPLLWMYINYCKLGNPLWFYRVQVEQARAFALLGQGDLDFSISKKILAYFHPLKQIYTPWLFWIGAFGLGCSLFKKKSSLSIVFLAVVSLYLFRYIAGTLVVDGRYIVFPSLFFLVFVVYGIYSIIEKIKIKKVILYGLMLVLSISWVTEAIREYPEFPAVWNQFIEYFQKNLKNGEKVVVLGSCHEILVKNFTRKGFSPSFFFLGDLPVEGTGGRERKIDTYWLNEYSKRNKPKYIVVDSSNYPFYKTTTTNEILRYFPGGEAKCVLNQDDANFIYMINYADGSK